MSDDITIREATQADIGASCRLFAEVFGDARPEDLWRWLFVETPAGPGHLVVAEQAGRLVAQVATVTRGCLVDGVATRCGQSIDAMTHPDWRRRGLNRRLSEALFEAHRRDGVELVYGFSNRNSTHGALSYQARQQLGPFPLLARPLAVVRRPWRVFHRRPRLPPPAAVIPPHDIDALGPRPNGALSVSVLRDEAALAWRYGRPGGRYREVTLRRGGQLQAWGVLGLRQQMGLRAAFVMEMLVAGDAPADWTQLASALLDAARDWDCDAISALAFAEDPAREALRRAGLWVIDERFNPEDIVLSVRRTEGAAIGEVFDARRWQIRWGEHDMV